MSSFFLYSNANRARVKEENPEAKFGDIVSCLFFAINMCRVRFFWGRVCGWRVLALYVLCCRLTLRDA